MIRRSLLVLVGVLLVQAAPAGASGLPLLGFVGSAHGITTRSGLVRYLTRPSGPNTALRALSGRSVKSATLPGRFMVPTVAYDGTPSGLSANGRTLVLVRPQVNFPQRATHLAIVDPRTLHVRSYVQLPGDFSVDAISPSGQWLYLIQYTSRTNPTKYRVRAFDTGSLHLLQRDIVDPHDRGEAMRGYPITRVASRDGSWEYTLYDGNGRPFVHALHTSALTARCIDVPAFPPGTNAYTARLGLTADRSRLLIMQNGSVHAAIDTRTLKVLAPAPSAGRPVGAARTARTGVVRTERQSSGALGTAVAIIAAFLLLAAATLLLRRRLMPVSRAADAQ
jgi:hypothetical protein